MLTYNTDIGVFREHPAQIRRNNCDNEQQNQLGSGAEYGVILMIALELLKNTRTPKDRSYQQAIEAMIRIREWTKDAVAQINALQEEIERAHQLLDEVGVGHPEWDLYP